MNAVLGIFEFRGGAGCDGNGACARTRGLDGELDTQSRADTGYDDHFVRQEHGSALLDRLSRPGIVAENPQPLLCRQLEPAASKKDWPTLAMAKTTPAP